MRMASVPLREEALQGTRPPGDRSYVGNRRRCGWPENAGGPQVRDPPLDRGVLPQGDHLCNLTPTIGDRDPLALLHHADDLAEPGLGLIDGECELHCGTGSATWSD